MINLVIAIIIVVIVALFSVQNAAPVSIAFLFWQFQASLAIIFFLCLLCGIVVGSALTFLVGRKGRRKAKQIGSANQSGKVKI